MGWTYRHKPEHVSVKEEILKELECVNEHGTWKVLAISVRSNVAYAATAYTPTGGETKVFGSVVLIGRHARDYYNFGTKVMDEGMGPCYCDCPAKILNMLSPTDCKYALDWRKACREAAAKKAARPKLAVGDRVKMARPLSFGGGCGTESEFVVVDPKKLHFRAGFGLCRIRRNTLLNSDYKVYRGRKLIAKVAA